MNIKLLPQLKEIEVVDASSAMLRCKFALAVFDYTHIERSVVEEYKIDMPAMAEEYGWHVEQHTLSFGIKADKLGVGSFKIVPVKPKDK